MEWALLTASLSNSLLASLLFVSCCYSVVTFDSLLVVLRRLSLSCITLSVTSGRSLVLSCFVKTATPLLGVNS
jgi:hypothetical protein